MKKTMSLLMVILMGFGTVAPATFADTPASASADQAEIILLAQLISLTGNGRLATDNEAALEAVVSDYLRDAPAEGMQSRLIDAAVEMGVLSPGQGELIRQQAQKSADQLVAAPNITQKNFDDVAQSFQSIFAKQMAGAQFSGCALTGFVINGITGLALLGLAGYLFHLAVTSDYIVVAKVGVGIGAFYVAMFGIIGVAAAMDSAQGDC